MDCKIIIYHILLFHKLPTDVINPKNDSIQSGNWDCKFTTEYREYIPSEHAAKWSRIIEPIMILLKSWSFSNGLYIHHNSNHSEFDGLFFGWARGPGISAFYFQPNPLRGDAERTNMRPTSTNQQSFWAFNQQQWTFFLMRYWLRGANSEPQNETYDMYLSIYIYM